MTSTCTAALQLPDYFQRFSNTSIEHGLFQEALHLFQNDQLEDAEKTFLQLSLLSPDNHLYGEFLGAIWFQLKQYQKALELFCHLATQSPNQKKALLWCAACLKQLNRMEEAEACQKLTCTIKE